MRSVQRFLFSILGLFWISGALAANVNPVPGSLYTYLGPSLGADWVLPGYVFPPRMNITAGLMDLMELPLGNGVTTFETVNVYASSKSTTTREFLMQLGFDVGTGVGLGAGGAGDRVGLYVGVVSHPGNGNLWASNFLITMSSGTSQGIATVSELDLNNNVVEPPHTVGPAGMLFGGPTAPGNMTAPPNGTSGGTYPYGQIFECAGTFSCTAAVAVAGSAQWLRGVGCFTMINEACFYDYTNGAAVLDIWGTHTNGIVFEGSSVVTNLILSSAFTVQGGGAVFINGSGDTALNIGSTGGTPEVWTLQVIESGGVAGRFRIYDSSAAQEYYSLYPGGIHVLSSLYTGVSYPEFQLTNGGISLLPMTHAAPAAGAPLTGTANSPSYSLNLVGFDSGGTATVTGLQMLGTNKVLVITNPVGAVNIPGMATSCSGLPVGTLWNSSGTVHVC